MENIVLSCGIGFLGVLFVCFEMGVSLLFPSLVSNSWAEVIVLPQLPTDLGLQAHVTMPSWHRFSKAQF